MRRRIALLAALAPFALPAVAGAVVPGNYFAGAPVDGPSADIQGLGDLEVARDGTGALAYVKRVGGVDHVFVSRLVDGAFQAPEQIDAALAGAGAQPAVAAADGGRIVVAFTSGGGVFTVVRAAGAPGFTAPQLISDAGSNPDVDMSINGVAFVVWSANGDVRAARMDRASTGFTILPDALDIDAAAVAGNGTGRPQVAIAADGIATVAWGESGHVYARRIFELRLSTAPQDLGDGADQPQIAAEDDSSYAWVVFRQGGRAVARRLLGSQFDPPVVIDGGEPADTPRIAMNGRGVGYAGVGSTSSPGAFGAVLKDDVFNPGVLLGGGFGVVPLPTPAVSETGDGLVAFQQGDAAGGRTIHARPYDYIPASRVVTQPEPDVSLTDPALGPTDAVRGLAAAADRAGDVVVAFVQGDGDGRQIVAATFDRAPGTFRTFSTSKWRNASRSPLKWGGAFELWGALTYRVEIDGQPVGETGATAFKLPPTVLDGEHRWRVVAVDRRGQTTATPTRLVRIDATAPKTTFKLSGAHKKGALVKVQARVSDATGTARKASGVASVRIGFGDGSAPVNGLRGMHRYGKAGSFTVSVTATDKVGNVIVVKRRVRIR
jgi:PKD domain-containing protein